MGLVKKQGASEEAAGDAAGSSMTELVRDLASADPSTRRSAAKQLLEYPGATKILCEHLERDASISVRSIILSGLMRNHSREAAEALVGLLRSEDVNLRNSAIEALQEMPDEVGPHIEELLSDSDSDVRIFTVNVLSALRHPNIRSWLRQVLEHDGHVNVCAAAIDALVEAGELDDIPLLEDMSSRFPGVPFIAFAAEAGIRRIRGR